VTAQQAAQNAARFPADQSAGGAGRAGCAQRCGEGTDSTEQQDQALQEAMLTMENARLSLAVIIFPTLNENFTVIDDLDSPKPLPPFPDIQTMAERENPDVRAASEAL
jgi:hypothetical protein